MNTLVEEYLKKGELFSKDALIRREVTYGKSRFDFYIEDGARKIFLEVKGVTLENDGIASFPDAPTERGVKHLNELCHALTEGFECFVFFVIQMKGVTLFTPNDRTHSAFGEALRHAVRKGVTVIAMECLVAPDALFIDKVVPVKL